MMDRRRLYDALVAVSLFGIFPHQPAFSAVNPFHGSHGEPMRQADMDALIEATNRLLDRPQLVPGSTETWSNPASGAKGTIIAGKQVIRHNLHCRVLQHRIGGSEPGPERNYTTTWCRTPDGWKLG
jgi:surface antigen